MLVLLTNKNRIKNDLIMKELKLEQIEEFIEQS